MRLEVGASRTLFIHLTLVPYIATAGEIKTKPTQHSVKELRSIGLQPDVLVCRSDRLIPKSSRSKIALFTNVEERAVVLLPDAPTIYQVPAMLHEQKLDDIVVEKFGLEVPEANLWEWNRVVDAQLHPERRVRIAIVGKYLDLLDAYKSLNEAIVHAGIQTRTKVDIRYVDAEDIETNGTATLATCDAILVPGGFGQRGFEGKIKAARYARENGVPYLGICYGLHAAVIDFARNVAGLEDAHSTEINPNTPYPGHRDDHRVGGSRRQPDASQRRRRPRRHDAARRTGVQSDVGFAGAADLRRRRGVRTASASLRGQRTVPRSAAELWPEDRRVAPKTSSSR